MICLVLYSLISDGTGSRKLTRYPTRPGIDWLTRWRWPDSLWNRSRSFKWSCKCALTQYPTWPCWKLGPSEVKQCRTWLVVGWVTVKRRPSTGTKMVNIYYINPTYLMDQVILCLQGVQVAQVLLFTYKRANVLYYRCLHNNKITSCKKYHYTYIHTYI